MGPLQHVSPNLILSDSVAIIGSSGSLRNSNYGNIIDNHKDIARFNRAPVISHEKAVGSKTTIRITNNHVFYGVPIKGFSAQPTDFVKNIRNTNILFCGPDMPSQAIKTKYTHESNNLFVFDYKQINATKGPFGLRQLPTVGTLFIMLCVKAGIKPFIYGFDVYTEKYAGTHYWEQRPPIGPVHHYGQEKKLLKELSEQNKIVIHD